jgi:hypothetical protein
MADEIERIVERAIEHTLALLANARAQWDVARDGLGKVHDDLALRAPGHPAVARLKAFVASQDQARAAR